MRPLTTPLLTILLLLYGGKTASLVAQELTDTAAINTLTQEAYLNARKNPDSSIHSSHLAITASTKNGYLKGRADASLALGMAYLAKYNPGDSALHYNSQALQMYKELNDNTGQARACYGLSYVYSIKGDLQTSETYGSMSLNLFEKAGD